MNMGCTCSVVARMGEVQGGGDCFVVLLCCPENVRRMCLENVCRISGKCLENVCRMPGNILARDLWICFRVETHGGIVLEIGY